MTDRSVFMTYNPGVELEQTLAIRLYTIGQVNGFEMYLPDRYNNLRNTLDQETAFRISNAKWFICFSTQRLSPKVRQEIEHAFQMKHDRSKIIVIYDASRYGKNIRSAEHFTEYYFDPRHETADQAMAHIISDIDRANRMEGELRHLQRELKKAESEKMALAAFLGIGIGLLALNTLADPEPEKPVRKPSSKKTAAKKSGTKKSTTKRSKKK